MPYFIFTCLQGKTLHRHLARLVLALTLGTFSSTQEALSSSLTISENQQDQWCRTLATTSVLASSMSDTVSVSWGLKTKRQTVRLKQQRHVSHSSGGWEYKIKVSAGGFLGRLPPMLHTATFLLISKEEENPSPFTDCLVTLVSIWIILERFGGKV